MTIKKISILVFITCVCFQTNAFCLPAFSTNKITLYSTQYSFKLSTFNINAKLSDTINRQNNDDCSLEDFSLDSVKDSQYYIVNDFADFLIKPKESLLNKHSWKTWTIPFVFLLAVDRPVTNFYEKNIAPKLAKLSIDNISYVSSDYALFGLVNTLYAMNTGLKNEKLERFVHSASEALIDGFLCAQIIKQLTGRARPPANKGPYSWGRVNADLQGLYTDFPSSHATFYQAFFTVAGLALNKERLFDVIGPLSYFILLRNHNHWMSSMLMGSLLGKAIGKYVWKKNLNRDFNKRWYIYPFLRRDMGSIPGIGIIKTF